jgi:hypothetical protein
LHLRHAFEWMDSDIFLSLNGLQAIFLLISMVIKSQSV